MSAESPRERYLLYYWPIPFRGCFVSYLFAYRDVPLLEKTDLDENFALKNLPPGEQETPYMGPPVFRDLETGHSLSQMPAITLYVAPMLDLLPEDPFDVAIGLKVLMDCNDVLMEVCRYNGSIMWERDTWREFRDERLPRWLDIFEESLTRGHVGQDAVSFADIAVFALFGNMTRCLPELDADVLHRAPGIHALCQRIGSKASLARFVAGQDREYGKLYCGGQIEESIRKMLAMDAQSAPAS